MSCYASGRLAPAYDLTYCAGPGGEHTTSFVGEGNKIGELQLKKLAAEVGIDKITAKNIVDEVLSGISFLKSELKQYGIKTSALSKVFDWPL